MNMYLVSLEGGSNVQIFYKHNRNIDININKYTAQLAIGLN